VFANDEATFSESLLGRWIGSNGYEIAFERWSPTMYTVAIRTGSDSSASTVMMRASLYEPLPCARGAGQAPLAAHVLELEPDLQGDLAGGWYADDLLIPVYKQWLVQVVGRQLRVDFLNSELGEAVIGGRMWMPALRTDRPGLVVLDMEADTARGWLERVLCARLVGNSPLLLRRRQG
jgi:hypothetical protein